MKNHRWQYRRHMRRKCDMAKMRFPDIYTAYEKEKKRLHKLDFDDMLLECSLTCLRSRPDILATVAEDVSLYSGG